MSNRLRRRVVDDDAALARIRQGMGCPDCRSRVTVNRKTGSVRIRHDPSCPSLRARERSGRTRAIGIVAGEGATVNGYTKALTEVTREVVRHHREIWPGSLGVRMGHAYADLDYLCDPGSQSGPST